MRCRNLEHINFQRSMSKAHIKKGVFLYASVILKKCNGEKLLEGDVGSFWGQQIAESFSVLKKLVKVFIYFGFRGVAISSIPYKGGIDSLTISLWELRVYILKLFKKLNFILDTCKVSIYHFKQTKEKEKLRKLMNTEIFK